jgi:hypothetical protein
MKNILLSVVVVSTLIAAGVGGTFAGFVDTEVSEGNFVEAGISDLLVNGMNDPIEPVLEYIHAAPDKSTDFFIEVYNWGFCQGGDLYLHYKDVDSVEAGTKLHNGVRYVYDGVATGNASAGAEADGYRAATGVEPIGAGVWSSEPEKISEVGDGYIAQYYISANDSNLLGEDYASGVSAHLDIVTEVCDDGQDGILDDADDNGDGSISASERSAHEWVTIQSLTGKLKDIECFKDKLGFLLTQGRTWIHVDVTIQQIWAEEWVDAQGRFWGSDNSTATGVDYDGDGDIDDDDAQKAGWPTNALQGDKATWAMLFELITDP